MPQSPNFSGSPATVSIVDSVGNPVTSPTTLPSGARATQALGAASLATNQVTVGTTATPVVPARTGRQAVTITSTAATVFYVGPSGVTTANGHYVAAAAGASVTIPTSAAVFAVVATGTLVVSFMETF